MGVNRARGAVLSARAAAAERVHDDLHPEQDDADGGSERDDRDGRVVRHLLERVLRHRRADEPDGDTTTPMTTQTRPLLTPESLDTLRSVLMANYRSGDDFVVEFLGHRFEFNADDFEERVMAAAVRLALVESNDLDDDEAGDLVELVADGRIVDPQSGLGPVPHPRRWERIFALVDGESLICSLASSSSAARGSTIA